MKQCYIIILNYRTWEDTLACIRSVFTSGYTAFKVIVVDNCSGNESLRRIREGLEHEPVGKAGSLAGPASTDLKDPLSFAGTAIAFLPDLTLLQNDRNSGFAAGNNIAIRALLGENALIWLLNPDMIVEQNTLHEMIGCLGQDQKTVVGSVHRRFEEPGTVLYYGGGRVNDWSGSARVITNVREIDSLEYISGGSLLTETAVFRSVGLLPEEYFLYWEETDWCHQARQKGYSMQVCLQATCYDKGGTSIGRGFLADYFYTRNGLLFLRKYKKQYLPTAFLLVFFRAGKKLLLGRTGRAKGIMTAAKDFLTGKRYENK